MIKLGVNSLLYKKFDFSVAVRHISEAGYDGLSLNAIKNNGEHLDLFRWREQLDSLRRLAADSGLELLAMEVSHLSGEYLQPAFEACAHCGIGIVNVGPGGRTGVEDDVKRSIEQLAKWSEKAAEYGLVLCAKAHQGHSIHNSETMMRALREIDSPGFGVDFDPSHYYRANEDPVEVLPRLLDRVRHVHIRDCNDRSQGGTIYDQTCGRGKIDLPALCRTLVQGGYDGPVDLEIIGSDGYPLEELVSVTRENYFYLNRQFRGENAYEKIL
jgi:sugar phosphate isomerase/epimerase